MTKVQLGNMGCETGNSDISTPPGSRAGWPLRDGSIADITSGYASRLETRMDYGEATEI